MFGSLCKKFEREIEREFFVRSGWFAPARVRGGDHAVCVDMHLLILQTFLNTKFH